MKNYLGAVLAIGVIAVGGWYLVNSSAPKVDALTIGVIESLTGNAAYYGEETRKGVELAKKELQEKYGDVVVVTNHQDSFYTPKGGVDAYNAIRASGPVDAVITHASPITMAVQPLAAADGVLQMAVSASVKNYSSPNDLSFRTSASTDFEAERIAQFISEKKYARLGILFFQNDIGVSVSESLKAELAKRGAETTIVFSEGFVITSTDFKTQLAKLKAAGADAVYIVGLASNVANILNQAADLSYGPQFLGFRSSEDPTLLTNAPTASEGFIYTYNFDPAGTSAPVQNFSKAFEEEYGHQPDAYAAEGYAGMKLIVEAFVRCGKDYACVGSYLTSLNDSPSVLGNLTFDENGDVKYDFFLKTVKDGRFVALEN